MYETEDKSWPEPEEENRFDWSLSFREMERLYNPSPVKPKKVRIGRYKEVQHEMRNIDPRIQIADQVKRPNAPSFDKFNAKFKQRFEYAHSLVNSGSPDMVRWLYDNIITKPEWTK